MIRRPSLSGDRQRVAEILVTVVIRESALLCTWDIIDIQNSNRAKLNKIEPGSSDQMLKTCLSTAGDDSSTFLILDAFKIT